MNIPKTEIEEKVQSLKIFFPKSSEIIEDIFQNKILKEKLAKDYLQNNFFEVLELVHNESYRRYLEYQTKASKDIIDYFISKLYEENHFKKIESKTILRDLLESFMPLAVEYEFSMANRRKSRAGYDLENILYNLLRHLGIECEITAKYQRKDFNRIDIVIPNKQVAFDNPEEALFLACKNTLRERWKQTLPEQNSNQRMFLITLEEDLPANKANEIIARGLIVYVRDNIKQLPDLQNKKR